VVLLDSGNPYHLSGRRHDKKGPAELARIIGVYPVFSLLLPHELQRFVLAGRHEPESSVLRFRPLEVLRIEP
jgi:hypothetical protein